MIRKLFRAVRFICPLLIMAAAVAALILGLRNLQTGREEESRAQLEDAIRRACVSCYAAEGAYPDKVDYLKEHYGLQIDEDRFAVFYEVFAKNLMPDISVISYTTGR